MRKEQMAIKLHYKIRHNRFLSTRGPVLLTKLAVIILMFAISSGCAFSKYRLAKSSTPPPIEMNLSLSQPPIDVQLHNVIVFKGPGSWKSKAYWDEYIVSIANPGSLPLSIELATLVDFQDTYNNAGSDPWKLEKQSKLWWKGIKTSAFGNGVVLGTGAGALAYGGLSLLSATFWSSTSGALVGAAAVVAAPVIVISSITASVRAHNKIEEEFYRRLLFLPATIQAGQVVQGSLFFPITPGPKRLILHYQMGDVEHNAEFDLSPLKALHMKETDAKLENSSSHK
jgi:hypothetical protein